MQKLKKRSADESVICKNKKGLIPGLQLVLPHMHPQDKATLNLTKTKTIKILVTNSSGKVAAQSRSVLQAIMSVTERQAGAPTIG